MITTVAICGEMDHPLLKQFYEHYSRLSDDVVVQYGVTTSWARVNGNPWGVEVFNEKIDQVNAALDGVESGYIMIFDVDEFISTADFYYIESLLESEPDVVKFQMNHFWKDNYIGVGGDGWAYNAWCPRIFKYHKGDRFVSHRPPTLEGQVKYTLCLTQKINHYSYVYEESIKRKLKYYNTLYTQFDYMKWYNEVWLPWTPENREQIEAVHSVHPSCKGAKTELFTGTHEINWKP
jgi:hypothetical protein